MTTTTSELVPVSDVLPSVEVPAIEVGAFKLGENGLIVSADASVDPGEAFADWEALGHILARIERASQFWVADWVNYGEGMFGEKASQVIDATGWKLGTIQQYARVAAKIPPERRIPAMSFSHHREVADLQDPSKQRWWLERARVQDWSAHRLRLELNESKAADAPEGGKQTLWLLVEFSDLAARDAVRSRLEGENLRCLYGEERPAVAAKAAVARPVGADSRSAKAPRGSKSRGKKAKTSA